MNLENFEALVFDFDGVILDSIQIKNLGFKYIFRSYPSHAVDELYRFHISNGGISRYVKIRYFFENILKEDVSEETVLALAQDFSNFVSERLKNKNLLIPDCLNFIKKVYQKLPVFIASGSDQAELKLICKELELENFFVDIYGSPTSKVVNLKILLKEYQLSSSKTLMIGDSINDFEAAEANQMHFLGYNSLYLKERGYPYSEKLLTLLQPEA